MNIYVMLFSVIFILMFSFVLRDIIVGLLTKYKFIQYAALIVFGILTEAGNFLIGSLTKYIRVHNLTLETTMLGILGLYISFSVILFLLKSVNVYTIGIPIVLTQLFIALILQNWFLRIKNILL